MQVKVVIGTAAFMLTMIILGYAALREPARLEDTSGAFVGRSVEAGGIIFDNNCASCHGVQGQAEACVDTSGNSIPCKGLPLNSYFLLCGEPSQRLGDLGWEGTTEQYIARTVTAGRSGSVMPAWSNRFGGPMRDDQIQNVTFFVMNWAADPEFCAEEPVEAFPWPDTARAYQETTEPVAIEAGNPELGAVAYQSYGCAGCHGQPETPGSAAVGPWLGEIKTEGATRIEGMLAQEYVYESILDPEAFIAPDCPNGPCIEPSIMPKDFAFRIGASNPQDMADILAYLMGDAYQYP